MSSRANNIGGSSRIPERKKYLRAGIQLQKYHLLISEHPKEYIL